MLTAGTKAQLQNELQKLLQEAQGAWSDAQSAADYAKQVKEEFMA